jgi:hypothetical protein
MTEQVLDHELDADHELWHLASDVDQSMKAAFYSLDQVANNGHVTTEEVRRDVRHAARNHHKLMEFLHSSREADLGLRDNEVTDELDPKLAAAHAAAYLLYSDHARQTEQRLHLEDLGTPQEPLARDRYSSWLNEPGRGRHNSQPKDSNAQVIRWYIQKVANFYSQQFEGPLR